jgi:outer membrane protein assembly factor BamD (BamD/ComL family)
MGILIPSPSPVGLRPAAKILAIAVAISSAGLSTWPRDASADWPWSGFREEAPVGSAPWWKKQKKKAVFEPGKGYKVEGADGYFDGDGRPIQGPVAVERVIEAGEDTEPGGLIPALDPKAQYNKVKTAVGLGPNEQFARQAYAEGDRLFRERDYKSAAKQFQQAVERGPHSPIEQDAMFMEAESYFFDDRYIKARDAYDALVKEHPNTRYLDTVIDRQWKIARFWEEKSRQNRDLPLTPNAWDKTRPWFDTLGHSVKTYDNIRLNDPTGPRADDAIMATANIYFERRRYEDADYHYTLLRHEYPRSELQYQAHLLGLQAKLRKYQGEDYDGTPLEEAKKLVKQLRTNFAGQLPTEEKERLRTVEAQLNLEIATRDYRMAEYFDGTKHYGAARHYYAKVIKNHPDTELATKAQQRVTEIASQPDKPTKPLARIVDLFPESSERTRVARIPELQKGGRLAKVPDAGGVTVGNATPDSTQR